MNRPAAIVNRFTRILASDPLRGANLFAPLPGPILGWSNLTHWIFFNAILGQCPEIKSVLICGVYRGLDLSLMTDAAKQNNRTIRLVGVDLFSDQPCADWPEELRGKTWEEAQSFPPPSMEAAREACPTAEIIQSNSIDYLKQHASEFDFIYLDTSHDYQTVHDEITAILSQQNRPEQSRSAAASKGPLLAGDDYAAIAGHDWGVERACNELLPAHLALFHRLWISDL